MKTESIFDGIDSSGRCGLTPTIVALSSTWWTEREHNTNAISLYRHRGYEEFDQHVFMFGGEGQRDVLMRLDLADRVGASSANGRLSSRLTTVRASRMSAPARCVRNRD